MRVARTHKILQLAGPQSVVLVEGVLINNCLQTGNFLLLGNDLLGDIVEHRLHCGKLVLQFLKITTVSHIMQMQLFDSVRNPLTLISRRRMSP